MRLKIYFSIIFLQLFSFSSYALNSNQIVFFIPDYTKPWLQNAPADVRYTFNTAILGQLIYVSTDFELHSDVLDKFYWDFKNHRYILKLKDSLYFHNGRKVTSTDFEFSLIRSFISKVSNESSMLLVNIKGLEKVQHGQAFYTGMVEGISILDDRTIAVTPTAPNPTFLYTLSRSNYALVPMEELTPDLLDWKRWPIGTGPYKIIQKNNENLSYSLHLVDIKNFPNAPQEIIFEQKRTLEPDVSTKDVIAAQDKNYSQKILTIPSWKRVFIFNFKSEFGQNLLFRKAVSLALFRQNITRKVLNFKANPLTEVITPRNIGQLQNKENYNLKKAKELFKKVLGNNNSFVFKIPFTPDSNMGAKYRAEITNQFKIAGLNVEFIEYANIWTPFTAEFSQSPFRLISLGADFFDPLLAFTYFVKNSPLIDQYPTHWDFDEHFAQAQASPSRDILHQNLQELSRIIIENNVMIPLFYLPTVIYFKQNKIKSLGEQYGGNTFYLSHIEVKK